MHDTEYPIDETTQNLRLVGEDIDADDAANGALPRQSRAPISGLYKLGARVRAAATPPPVRRSRASLRAIEEDLESDGESDDEIDLEALMSAEESNEPFADEDEAGMAYQVQSEELRIDVDGRYPLMTASGAISTGWRRSNQWIAKLKPYGRNAWLGWIWNKHPTTTALPYTRVYLKAKSSVWRHQRQITAIFFGGGAPRRVRRYKYASSYFHSVEFEFDYEAGTSPALVMDTHAHSNRPASLPRTPNLTPEETYKRAGFQAKRSRAANSIPNDGPDRNATWSDGEMHDAMQTYWSRFANRPQWALWTLWAGRHDIGHRLGGIMFDSIGPNHRQGTAVFENSFISDPAPAGDPAPAAFVNRLRYWTLIHEMGHAFNLAHSWDKHRGTPWMPTRSNREDRSFMNYPYFVRGGEAAFFSDFEYRFTDPELLFLRHAPSQFVQQGNADWFDNHGFESPDSQSQFGVDADLALEIEFNRSELRFEFLEPVMLGITIQNTSRKSKTIPKGLIKDPDHVTVIIKKEGKPARQWSPYARYLTSPEGETLRPGGTISDDLFISAGLNGWDLAEPGFYDIQVQVELDDEILISNKLRIQVEIPKSRIEEVLAQDIFTEDAGRVMKFDGSTHLHNGVKAWENLVDKRPKLKAADHALLALALPKTRNYRVLNTRAEAGAQYLDAKASFKTVKSDPETADKMLRTVLVENPQAAAATLGYNDFAYYCETSVNWCKVEGDKKGVADYTKALKEAKPYHTHAHSHLQAAE